MLRFLLAILVMITLLSNLNAVNGIPFHECMDKCYIRKDPDYSKNCLKLFPEIKCVYTINYCIKECSKASLNPILFKKEKIIMLRFLIAILVITFLSNLNEANGNDFFKCFGECCLKKDPNYADNCSEYI
ncbi:hypothetical protein ACTFIR_000464 [Dictyostelium discoideum]